MITEIAYYEIKPGTEAEFEATVRKNVHLLRRAKGCRGLTLHRSIQKPQRYWIVVQWDTVENHSVDLPITEDFKVWRDHLRPFFTSPPQLEYTNPVL